MDAKTRRVIRRVTSLWIKDAVFKVSPAGRQRALRTRQRNVHAFVCGTVTTKPVGFKGKGCRVTYSPFSHESFVDTVSGVPVLKSSFVEICPDGVWAWDFT